MAKLKVAGVIEESVVDGPGIRYTIFVQGCPHGCPGCHNPQTHPFEGGVERDAAEMMGRIKKDPLISGVTFSGGEPFCQADALCELAALAHEAGKNVLVYSGFTYEKLMEEAGNGHEEYKRLLDACDWLIDGPFVLAERDLNLQFRGSRNQRMIDLNATRREGHPVIRERL